MSDEEQDRKMDEHLLMSAKANKFFDLLFGLGTFAGGVYKLIAVPSQVYPATLLILGGYLIFSGESLATLMKILSRRR